MLDLYLSALQTWIRSNSEKASTFLSSGMLIHIFIWFIVSKLVACHFLFVSFYILQIIRYVLYVVPCFLLVP